MLLLCSCATASIALAQTSGSCGSSCSWAITGSGASLTLTISGSGAMEDYTSSNTPWKSSAANITAIAIGPGVTSIGSYAFYKCTSLTSITIPATVASIGSYAFYNTRLTSVAIPAQVTDINEGTFRSCTALTAIHIPEGVKSIGISAFEYCSALKDITIPTSVKNIRKAAFRSCATLTSVVVPEGVLSIEAGTFAGCSELTSVSIPQSVFFFDDQAFYSCKALKDINIPKNLTTIGNSCFSDCAALTSITLPETLLSIGYHGFQSCTTLTSVTIPKGVFLGYAAFSGCTALTSVTLSEGVTFGEMDDITQYHTFTNCSKLNTIINFSERPQNILDKNLFSSSSFTATLFVPLHLLAIYQASSVWQDFSIAIYKGRITASDFGGAKDSSVIYDGSPHGIGAIALRPEFTDVCSVVGPYYTGVNGTTYATAAALPTDAGAYSAAAGIDYTAASGFRDTSVVLGTLTIRKAVPTRAHFDIASSGGLTHSYDGLAHGVKALLKDSRHSGLGAVTVKYNGRSTGSPVNAGVYDITVSISEGENFSAVTDLWLDTLTISKAKPAAEHLSYALTGATYDGLPHAASVSPNEAKYEGMGAITVRYNGGLSLPVSAGEYDVSVDIADGLNFGSVSGLPLGKFAIRYSVTFESSGGSAVAGQTVLPGAPATAPPNPTKLNNIFAGWYSNEELTTLWSFPSDKVTGNTKLYARWIGSEKATCKVSFNSNGGSAVDAQIAVKNSTAVRPTNPTKAGNTFAGWYSNEGLTTLWNFPTDKVTGSFTLYAKWIGAGIPTGTLSFNSNGGSPVEPQIVAVNSPIARPVNPTKRDCVFAGWYANAELTNPWNFSSGRLAGSMTLYAKWIANGTTFYTVSFNSGGGSAIDDQTVAANSTAARPANPTKATYSFAGWYADEYFSKLWSFSADKVTADRTLYARWISAGTPIYTVSFNSNGGSPVDTQLVEANKTVAPPASPAKAGHTFVGWYSDAGFTALWNFYANKVTADRTLHARWIGAATPYTASIDSSVTYDGSPHGVGSLTLNPQFAGTGAITATYYAGAGYPKTTAAPTNAGVYALTVDIDFDENTSLRDTSVAAGTLAIRKATPAKAHLAFTLDSSLAYDGLPHNVPVAEKGTLYSGMGSITVKYNGKRTGKPVNADVYDVTVDIAEGANFSAATDIWLGALTIGKAKPTAAHLVFTPNISVVYNGSPHAFPVSPNNSRYSGMGIITVKYGGSVAPPINAGKYDITVDISEGTNFGSKSDLPLGTLTIGNSAAAQHRVAFESNGGSPVPAQTVAEGATAARPANPAKSGHTFVGWYADAGLTTLWSFSADKVTKETTLYARWISAGTPIYTVSFNSNGGSPVDTQLVEANKTVALPASPAKAGHTFVGWYSDAGFTALWNFYANKVTADTTLYAYWMLDTVKMDGIRINGVPQEVKDTIEFSIPCDNDKKAIEIQYFYASGASTLYVDASRSFMIDTAITITDKGRSRQYTLRLKNRFEFDSIVHSQLGGKLLMVVKNPENNGGFSFQAVRWWHKDGRPIKNSKFYYASPSGEVIADTLYLSLLDSTRTWFETCPSNPAAAASKALNMVVYPNPVSCGAAIYLTKDFGVGLEERYETFYLLDIQGNVVRSGKTSELRNGVAMPNAVGIYHLVLKGKAGRLLNKIAVE